MLNWQDFVVLLELSEQIPPAVTNALVKARTEYVDGVTIVHTIPAAADACAGRLSRVIESAFEAAYDSTVIFKGE